MAAPGTSGLFMVAMVRHKVRCGEVVDVGNPLGGVWYVSAWSVHDGLPEEKGWERQYKSDRLTCPDRMQNRCYSVQDRVLFCSDSSGKPLGNPRIGGQGTVEIN